MGACSRRRCSRACNTTGVSVRRCQSAEKVLSACAAACESTGVLHTGFGSNGTVLSAEGGACGGSRACSTKGVSVRRCRSAEKSLARAALARPC